MSKQLKKQKKRLWFYFSVALIATLVADLFTHPHDTFVIEAVPFFYAIFGFVSCALIVIISKIAGLVLKRPEGYYKQGDAKGE